MPLLLEWWRPLAYLPTQLQDWNRTCRSHPWRSLQDIVSQTVHHWRDTLVIGKSIPHRTTKVDLCTIKIKARIFLSTSYYNVNNILLPKPGMYLGVNLRAALISGRGTCSFLSPLRARLAWFLRSLIVSFAQVSERLWFMEPSESDLQFHIYPHLQWSIIHARPKNHKYHSDDRSLVSQLIHPPSGESCRNSCPPEIGYPLHISSLAAWANYIVRSIYFLELRWDAHSPWTTFSLLYCQHGSQFPKIRTDDVKYQTLYLLWLQHYREHDKGSTFPRP